jgi:hypothetical protein
MQNNETDIPEGSNEERRVQSGRRRSAFCVLRSAFCIRPRSAFCIPRFVADESGQGILFAAATLLLLLGFVAFVFNIGRLLDRRTKVQIAADAAAYSGAMVEADAVSAIAYINSAMSQVYYNALKYAVDMNESAVAAELEYRMTPQYYGLTLDQQGPNGPAWQAYYGAPQGSPPSPSSVYFFSSTGLQQAKQWMVQLSQLENAIAIVAPRLIQEEMYAVAGRTGGERMSVFPSFRMFPSSDGQIEFQITQLTMLNGMPNGWLITQVYPQSSAASLQVTFSDNIWDLQWTSGASSSEVQITQNSPTSWQVSFFQPIGNMLQQVSIVDDPVLGWVVSGSSTGGGTMPPISFTPLPPVTVDGQQVVPVQISQGGYSQVLMRSPDGNISVWNGSSYVPITQNSTTIGGVNVQVNVTNTITFAGGGSAQIGNPTTVNIGPARITLSNPPTIGTGFGPVWISITGNQPSISVGGFSLTAGGATGQWIEHYNPVEETWWQNRLIGNVNGNPLEWQYDYWKLGALLANEGMPDTEASSGSLAAGGIACHALSPALIGQTPAWTSWFNPYPPYDWPNTTNAGELPSIVPPSVLPGNGAMPYDITTTEQYAVQCALNPPAEGLPLPVVQFGLPDPATGIRHALNAPPSYMYYQTAPCALCGGTGNYNGGGPGSCPACHGLDNCFPNANYTNVRVFIGDLANTNPPSVVRCANPAAQNFLPFPDDFYLSARMFSYVPADPGPNGFVAYPSTLNSSAPIPITYANLPLVATEYFFARGLNIGVWTHAYNGGPDHPNDVPMLFPNSREPYWGTVAIASGRVGLSTEAGGFPSGGVPLPNVSGNNSYLCQFSDEFDRQTWCQNSLQNLYYADVQAALFASKNQVLDFDLNTVNLQPPGNVTIDETGLSYLWTAVLTPHVWLNGGDNWLDRFGGQADRQAVVEYNGGSSSLMPVGQALGNMQNRQGATFDSGSGQLNNVVEH